MRCIGFLLVSVFVLIRVSDSLFCFFCSFLPTVIYLIVFHLSFILFVWSYCKTIFTRPTNPTKEVKRGIKTLISYKNLKIQDLKRVCSYSRFEKSNPFPISVNYRQNHINHRRHFVRPQSFRLILLILRHIPIIF